MITKELKEDKIEIVGDYKSIQVRTATVIKEDGVELTRSFHRHAVQCTDDISEQSAEVQAIGNAVWTDELKADYQTFLDNQNTGE
jgi:CRISPR/Cas system CMR-associated protein Cmr5 small subunit